MCPSSCPVAGIGKAPLVVQLVDLADIVQHHPRQQQVGVHARIMRGRQLRQRAQRNHVLDQPAQKRVVDLLGGRRAAKPRRHVLVVQHRLQQPLQMRVGHPCHIPAQFRPHLFRVAPGTRKIIGVVDLAIFHPPHFVDGQLRPVVEYLHQPFYLDEIVALEQVHRLGDVVPHLRVELARTVPERQREIQLAALLLPDLLGVNQETGGDDLVWLQLVYVGGLHCLSRGLRTRRVCAGGGACAGGAVRGWAAPRRPRASPDPPGRAG